MAYILEQEPERIHMLFDEKEEVKRLLNELSIEIIRKCPNACLHCSSDSGMNCTEIIPFEVLSQVIVDAKTLGARTICLSGGEPFLHADIQKIIRLVYSLGMSCYIYSSGITLDETGNAIPIPEPLLKSFVGYGVKVIFNIEAGTSETYDRIMGTVGRFSIMQESVRNAVKVGLCAEAHFVPMKLNVSEIPTMLELSNELAVSKVSFLRLVEHGRAEANTDELTLSDEDTKLLKKQLRQLKEAGNSIRIGVPLSVQSACGYCEAAKGKLNIRYDGKVFPCEVFKNRDLTKVLGSVQPCSIYEQSLVTIYQTSAYLQKVREFSDQYSGSTCEVCVGQHLLKLERGVENGN